MEWMKANAIAIIMLFLAIGGSYGATIYHGAGTDHDIENIKRVLEDRTVHIARQEVIKEKITELTLKIESTTKKTNTNRAYINRNYGMLKQIDTNNAVAATILKELNKNVKDFAAATNNLTVALARLDERLGNVEEDVKSIAKKGK